MQFALLEGCQIPARLPAYATATRQVLASLSVHLVEIEFNCCGYPIRDIDEEAYLHAAVRNIALAGRRKSDLLTPCQCCFGSLRMADHRMRTDAKTRGRINARLAEEGLQWSGETRIFHLLTLLDRVVGVDRIREQITRPLKGVAVAAHYGCHALRPATVTHFDHPLHPRIFERLIEATGARSVSWPKRLECCGRPLWEKNRPLSVELTKEKLRDAGTAGAAWICTACTHCQLQFDQVREPATLGHACPPAILYPHLLGLSMGLDPMVLGLDADRVFPPHLDGKPGRKK